MVADTLALELLFLRVGFFIQKLKPLVKGILFGGMVDGASWFRWKI